MDRRVVRILRGVSKTMAIGLAGAFFIFLGAGIHTLNQKPDLKVWHTAELDEEFTTKSSVSSFAEYLALEDRLFEQLSEEVYDQIEPDDQNSINRYHRGSLSDPGRWPSNWNRSFELGHEPSNTQPRAGVLLIHGLSDSPYSLRAIGEQLHAKGAHVVGLRVPGHGTAPSGLVDTKWQDMAAAVEIAMRHLSEQVGDRPIYMVGYSNGGALAVQYALSALEDPELPKVQRIVLISPEIGVSPAAALAIWQKRIGWFLGLKKLAWNDVLPEYDPFKYGSFAVNAGDLAYQLTNENRIRLSRMAKQQKLGEFPPVLAFQSVVDATVSAPALVKDLFNRLPEGDHELVLFGLNRTAKMEPLFKEDPTKQIPALRNNPSRTFVFSHIVNAGPSETDVIEQRWGIGESNSVDRDIGLRWPDNVYSLAHVALPFPENDPVYGGDQPKERTGISLGNIAMRGEKGVLQVSAIDMLRLRWNPFYPYLEERVLQHLGLSPK